MSYAEKIPEMCEDALNLAKNSSLPIYEFDKIAFCGIGGSAIIGYLVKDLLEYDFEKPIGIFGDYRLPKIVDDKTLAIIISYSGNTEETLSQFTEALKRKCKIIAIASGGKLEEWCKKLNMPIILVPKGYQPRMAVPYLFISVLICLEKMRIKNFEKDIMDAIQAIKRIDNDKLDEISLSLKGNEIAICAANDFSGVARRFKNELNENSKIPVMWQVLPEFDHNDIVGYQNPELNKNRSVIFIRNEGETPEMRARIEITEDIIKPNVKNVNEIWAVGKSRLAKILSLIYMAAYISCKLADLNNDDVNDIKFIDELKERLKKKVNLVEKMEKSLF